MREIVPKVTRRGFLQATAGAGAGVTLAGITVKGVSAAVQALSSEVRPPDGPETWVTTTCLGCAGSCGLLVRKIGERAVYLKGNPEHPVSRGGVCPRALAALQWTYHPDRLRGPLRKARGKKSGRWEEVSWDDALREIAERWKSLQQANNTSALVFLTGRRAGLLYQLMRRFLAAFPRAHLVTMPSGMAALEQALSLMQGLEGRPALDLESARYVLNFGCNLVEGWGAPVAVMRAFARWRDTGQGLRTKLVHVGPRLSITGAKADEWVPVRPGTEPVLALGIAHALITENLYDRDFVAGNTSRFDDWVDATGKTHAGFRSRVLREYRLGDVSALTDVPVETILRLARELAANPPALALGDSSSSFQPGSIEGSMAVHSLNLLLGSAARLVREGPAQIRPAWSLRDGGPGTDSSNGVAELWSALRRGEPYSVGSLFLCEANPVVQLPGGKDWREALSKVPFVVVSAPFLDESAAQADLVLPAPVFLETWDETPSPAGCTFAAESIVAPVVKAQSESRHPGDALLAAGRLLGGRLAESLPSSDFAALVAQVAPRLFEQQRGYVFSNTLESTWDRLLQRTGWWAPTYSNAEELWKQIVEHGGWWDPGSQENLPQRLSESEKLVFLPGAWPEWPAGIFTQAQSQRAVGDAAAYPLTLEPFEVLPLLGGLGAEAPFLAQSLGQHLGESWETWVEIHPRTAERFGVAEQQGVWVESARGRILARARLRAGLHPDVIAVPLGLGRTEGSRWSKNCGTNPADLLASNFDPKTGLPRWWGERVRIYPV